MKKLRIHSRVQINVDLEKLPNVPDEKIEHVIGQILVRFGRWSCDTCRVMNDGDNMLICYFENHNETKIVMGVVWREATQEFTFHT